MDSSIPPGVSHRTTLRDGTTISVDPISAADGADLERFHESLSQETTRLRFFSPHPRLSEKEVTRFTSVDHHDREALVMRAAGEIVAIARYDRPPGSSEAEVAFVVRDDQQGRGAATILLLRLAERAREEGISRFVADTLSENRRMVDVFEHTGWVTSTQFESGVVRLIMDLAVGHEPTPATPDED
jgi:RimJ/RimL family protein N-acetyltransferase